MNKCLERVKDRHFWNPGVFQLCNDNMSPQLEIFFFHCHIYSLWSGSSIAIPNFSEIAFSVGHLHKVETLEFSIQTIDDNDELVCPRCMMISVICNSKNPNLLLQNQVMRSWVWNLTILGGQWKSAIVALSVVYDIEWQLFNLSHVILVLTSLNLTADPRVHILFLKVQSESVSNDEF